MRNRNMYYATGMPGWMRFGYSPGWGGMPPCAPYFMGQPAPQAWPMQTSVASPGFSPVEAERDMIAMQLEAIADQLAFIANRLDALDEVEQDA
ncbi:MAG: hypothetical protein QM473_16920 [Acidobacteriota bacterium]|nr:hypothetical protein [Acidobacteriota bacterium]